MSSKLLAASLAAAVCLSSIGCAGSFVSKDQYDRDTTQLKEYNAALERDNAEMRPKAEAYDRLKLEKDFAADANRFYGELADTLKKALAGMGVDSTDIIIEKDRVTFGTDILFEIGSWTLTPKGKEILGKFASAQKGHGLRIVGHTDKKPIVTEKLKKVLDTDTNLELSTKRAVAVMGELRAHGVSERAMTVEGKGSTQPRGGDKTSRRVEIFLVQGEAQPVAPTSAVRNAKTSNK